MSDTVLIVLVVAVCVLVVIFLVRERLGSFGIRAGGMAANLKVNQPHPAPPPGVVIRGNVQHGMGSEIDVNRAATVEDNDQIGVDQSIRVGPADAPGRKKPP